MIQKTLPVITAGQNITACKICDILQRSQHDLIRFIQIKKRTALQPSVSLPVFIKQLHRKRIGIRLFKLASDHIQ